VIERSNEQRSIKVDARVQSAPIDGRSAIVVHWTLGAHPKPNETVFELLWLNLSELDTQRECSAAFCNFSREQYNIAIAARRDALQAALIDAPILQRIRPIVRSRPRAAHVARPCGAKYSRIRLQ
jgi:hypothetical protein